jgi:hypothetical protein
MITDITAQEITLSRARFPKPVEQYRGVAFFGHNIVVSEDEEWKKYRKIAAPTFSDVSFSSLVGPDPEIRMTWQNVYVQRNNRLVWDESLKIVQELFDGSWADQDVITVNHAIEITLPVWLHLYYNFFPSFLTRGFYRLHFSLLELQVCACVHSCIFNF